MCAAPRAARRPRIRFSATNCGHCGAKAPSASPFVFASERGGPFTPSGFAKLLARAGDEAKIGFKVHPHMLRHACGYALANKGIDTRTLQAYLGHRSINSTTRYAALAPGQVQKYLGAGVALRSGLRSCGAAARLFLRRIRQHLVDACDDLPGMLDGRLALLDLCRRR